MMLTVRHFVLAAVAVGCVILGGGDAARAQTIIAPVTSDAPAGGLVFTVHRGAGSPHVTAPEPIRLTNAQNPTAAWTATTTEPWLDVSPESGTSPSVVSISIDAAQAANLSVGNYLGGVQFVSPIAPTDILTISVSLRITDGSSLTGVPIGLLETPAQNAMGLSGAVAVTGWAIDDVGIQRVRIFRDPIGSEPPGLVFLGDATRVRGARPDIVSTFPGRPELTSAGWGFMVLSNVLPNGGNGPVTFSALAEDFDGHLVTLGQRSVVFDNTNSLKPFGTIDFPTQGGTMSGTFANQGWILAQPTAFIPFDGSTIRLLIDGAVQPNVALYGSPRPDVAALFPSPPYQNGNGPAVQFSIDTTTFTNGLHTIVWVVTDSDGFSQGIGSRFVNIENSSAFGAIAAEPQARSASSVRALPQSAAAFVWDRKGLDAGGWSLQFAGAAPIELRQAPGERLEVALDTWWLSFGCGPYAGYLMTGDVAAPLPPGASLDGEQGFFRWLPPVEFAGTFEFSFVRACSGREERIPLRVVIGSK
jgi:hypothetical protein